MTTLLKIMDIKRHLPILVCCLSLAACGSGGTGAAGAVTAPAVAAQAPGSAPAPITLPISINSAPTASAVTVTDINGGSVVVGDVLAGSYVYADVDGDAEGVSTFRWLRNGVAIAGAVGANYTLITADKGATISFEVTPVAATGVKTGSATTSTPSVTVTNVTNKIIQFGITWTFPKSRTYGKTYGQFANGDYWVVGPVTITNIFPLSIVDTTGRTTNGSMINPSPRGIHNQGFDSLAMSYVPTLNVARPNQQDMSSLNPLIVPVNSSLMSTTKGLASNTWTPVGTAAILTVLSSAPAAGSFRPPYSGTNKTIKFNKSQLNFSLLKNLNPPAGAPALATVERAFERPWPDFISGWVAAHSYPADNMPTYGRDMSSQVGIGALMLNMKFTVAQKEKLLVSMVQLGIDTYGVVQDGGNGVWGPDGGNAGAQKFRILFAGVMLNDTAMKAIGPGDGTGTTLFGDDAQTFYVTQADINLVHITAGSGTPVVDYVQTDLGLPEWGIRHATAPQYDSKSWTAAYRNCCTTGSWAGYVLAARMMGMQTLWAHNALFDYEDRYMTINLAGRTWLDWTSGVWKSYRPLY